MNKIKNLFKSISLATITGVLVVSLAIMPLAGCTSNEQKTAASLVQTLGSVVAQVVNLEGHAALGQTISVDSAAAVDAINNWVPGGPTQSINQALGLVVKDLNLIPIPVSDTDKALIAIAVTTAQALLTEFSTTKVALGNPAAHVAQLKVSADHVATLKSDFKFKVNDVVSGDTSRTFLKVK